MKLWRGAMNDEQTNRTARALLAFCVATWVLVIPLAGAASATVDHRVTWHSCSQPAATQYHAQCGTLQVPVNWTAPNGPSFGLALLRIPATGTATGTVVADSEDLAGYGGSEISFFLQHGSNFLSRLPRTHATKDIVIFDPRGMGASAGLSCSIAGHDPRVSAFPTTPEAYGALVSHNAAVFRGCRSAVAGLPSHMGVLDQARDVEAIRLALGAPRLNWIGQAMGGELGLAYAALYPSHTGAMILDATMDPYRPAPGRATDVAAAEETEFQRFASWCGRVAADQCALHGQDVGKAFDATVAKADAGGVSGGPEVPRPLTGEELRITAGQFLVGYTFAWSGLAQAIVDANSGDGEVFGIYSALTYTEPDHTVSRAQVCGDESASAPGYPQLRRLVGQVSRLAPHTGGVSLAWDAMAGCVGLPHLRSPLRLPSRIRPTSTVLVTGTMGDPITPVSWARDVAGRVSGSRLLTADVQGHGGFDNSPCAAAAMDAYLDSGRPPAPGTRC
jgi:pimeloyl-ACP methyl ester carboxylesterase